MAIATTYTVQTMPNWISSRAAIDDHGSVPGWSRSRTRMPSISLPGVAPFQRRKNTQ